MSEAGGTARPAAQNTWEEPFPFELHELAGDRDWEVLAAKYRRQPRRSGDEDETEPLGESGEEADGDEQPLQTDRPLLRCLEVARGNGARTAVVETRYVDVDYRSEYSSFYSRAFQHYEDSTHRIHFFSAELSLDDVWRLPESNGYLGYMIVRPQVRGIVGRTMLKPPAGLARAVRTQVKETVGFFGQPVEVRAAPFMQQDARLGSCAQAAAWMCHYSAFRGDRGVERRPMAAFSDAVDPGLAPGRVLPSTGLSVEQLSKLLGSFGLPPLYYQIDALDESDRPNRWPPRGTGIDAAAKRLCCRYLNSGLPVLAIVRQWTGEQAAYSSRHALVACGYIRPESASADIYLIVNDDRRGPYLEVKTVLVDSDPETNECFIWDQVLVPMPEKLWMSSEAAERNGCIQLIAAARKAAKLGRPGGAKLLSYLDEKDRLTVRTYATTANRFKERLRKHCNDPVILKHYMLLRMPRFVWVVEAIDRKAREAAAKDGGARVAEVPCVIGEVVFDATSDDLQPDVLATRLPGLLSTPKPWDPLWDIECGDELIASGGQYDP
jgi:hypothetical protein